jgi:hypothetical protein
MKFSSFADTVGGRIRKSNFEAGISGKIQRDGGKGI